MDKKIESMKEWGWELVDKAEWQKLSEFHRSHINKDNKDYYFKIKGDSK